MAKMFSEKATDEGVVFGVYGIDEWIGSTYLKDSLQAGQSTIADEATWITELNFKLAEWIPQLFSRFNFVSTSRALGFADDGYAVAMTTRGKLEMEFYGTPTWVSNTIKKVDQTFKRAENLIEWVYGQNGESASVPLNFKPLIKSAYPWINGDPLQYIENYMNSSSCVLILIGPPGTGKTSFIKSLIHHSKADAQVTFDERVMANDSLFANFIQGTNRFMVMEDADTFLRKREDGNTMMHRFLNVSEGLVSTADKKLVFSTNLPSTTDIDEALLRPGRCYDILQFRSLNRQEATAVADEMGLELRDGDQFTLAEVFGSNNQPSGKKKKRSVGFV